ncbi:amidase [Candidatus Uabimicrobium amorphum]|uniref:Amidase n=1 Tax=Uabimicrobium amorphum TaxID=2596890 RepID=A0A5S9ISX0_UABAM|nr:amidase [Candidatus Uabimicrobium amorphum]BBM86950.1 amidase [Candidatus Uabimicrobium amorphum]
MIPFSTTTTVAKNIREGRYTASDALEAYWEHFTKYNSKVNAVVATDIENARAQAKKADEDLACGKIHGPLHGVPMTIKDSYNVKGFKTTLGIPFLKNYYPDRDATVVKLLKDAGAIIWGKTNVPLFCYDWQCKHPHYGKTNNPWNLNHTPGGSSGGSAASVAVGFSPLEMGSDVAGSIRVPAHFCGISALRPTEGVVSCGGHAQVKKLTNTLYNYMACGPMARSVEDLQLAMSLVGKVDECHWRTAPLPSSDKKINDLHGIKIAWCDEIGGIPPSTEVRQHMQELIDKLQKAGAIIEKQTPRDIDFNDVLKIWGWIQGFESGVHAPQIIKIPPFSWLLRMGFVQLRFGSGNFSRGLAKGLTMSTRNYFRAQDLRSQIIEKMENFLSQWDVWLSPAAATLSFPHCRTGTKLKVDDRKISYSLATGMYNCPTAMMANPIVSLPIAKSQSGLPIGIQIHAKRWRDLRLLEIAQHIEKLCEPLGKPPIVSN